MIDFEIPAELAELRDEVARVRDRAGRAVREGPALTPHGPTDDLRQELVELARKAGLLTIQAPGDYGGWSRPTSSRR